MQAEEVIDDPVALSFRSADHAYQWAEEQSTRTKAKGFYNVMVGGSGAVSWDEIQECASTILVALTELEDDQGREAFRAKYAVYPGPGTETLLYFVTDLIGKHLAARGRGRDQLEGIAQVAVMRQREAGQGRRVSPRAAYARRLGVKRQSLDTPGLRQLIRTAEDAMSEWVKRGERDFADVLRMKGIQV